MRKILLVDDESAARDHIRNCFPWLAYGCEIIGEAGNGEEALEQCRRLNPDIALIDITMPVMDGMELLDRLERDFPHIRSIVLTAHRDFAYAQQAMLHRACGYVLKAPISMVEMKKALDRAFADLDRDRDYDRSEKSHAQMLRSYQYPLRRKFFADIRNGVLDDDEEIVREGSKLDIHLTAPEHGLVVCAADKMNEYVMRYPERDRSLIEFSMLEIVRETLNDSERYPFELLPLEFGRFALLFGCDSADAEPYAARVSRVCRTIAVPLENYLHMHLSATFSRPLRSLSALRPAFAETMRFASLRFYQDRPTPIDAGGLLLFQPVPEKQWETCRLELADTLREQDAELLQRFDKWLREVHYLLRRFQPRPDEALGLLAGLEPVVGEQFPVLPGHSADWPPFRSFACLGDALAALQQHVYERVRLHSNVRELRPEISAAIQYIRSNLHAELTLDTIAHSVQLSASYFGHLFKKEMGVTLVDYIVEQRIEQAKKWLADGKYRNYELAEKIGFSNYSYFCTLFKKQTGMTPNEFKNVHKTRTII
ncbi:response regulator [Paenibacillus hodogayensis]|uniref:Response regulator n=1 Tax=Paenibacillus hodogayensis TaxID=279208 RepID=A0ABV5VY36_9BACL